MATLIIGAAAAYGAYRWYTGSQKPSQGEQTASSPSLYQRAFGGYRHVPEEPISFSAESPQKSDGVLSTIIQKVQNFFTWIKSLIFGSPKKEGSFLCAPTSVHLNKHKHFLSPSIVPANIDVIPTYKAMKGSLEEKRNAMLEEIAKGLPRETEMSRRIADCLVPKTDLIQDITYDPKLNAYQLKLKDKLKARFTKVDRDDVSVFSKLGMTLKTLEKGTLETFSDKMSIRVVGSGFVFGQEELEVTLPIVGSYGVVGICPHSAAASYSGGKPGMNLLGVPAGKKDCTYMPFDMDTFNRAFPNLVWEVDK